MFTLAVPFTSKLNAADPVPIPTNPLSNTTNDADALVFSTRKAVVADVVPEPLTCNVEDIHCNCNSS